MATDLRTANSSRLIHLGSKFRQKAEKEKVYVYVEDDIDIVFWRHFFRKHESKYSIIIQPLQIGHKELRGKASLLSKIDLTTLGKNKIICIDSDFDLIIPDYSIYSNKIISNKYILTTYLYSIESFKCHHSNLIEYIYKSTLCDNITEDIKEVLETFSILISDLFLILLTSIYKKDDYYSLKDFGKDLSKISYSKMGFPNRSTDYVHNKVDKMKDYKQAHIIEIKEFESYLRESSFLRCDYYLLINGHDLVNYIVIPILKFIIKPLRGNKISKIHSLKEGQKRKETLLQQYYNQTNTSTDSHSVQNRIKQLINDCTSYDIGSIYSVIQKKIDNIY